MVEAESRSRCVITETESNEMDGGGGMDK